MREVVLVVFAMVIAGCGFSGSGAADDVGDDGVGADAATDAPVTGADRDGDGVLDAADLCPDVADPVQNDEDADGAGDRCDVCPQVAGATDDADGDHIGDACDPNPATPGDELLVFDGFAGATLDPAWTVIVGDSSDWQAGDGVALVQGGEPASLLMQRVGAPGDTLRVDTAMEVTAIGPGATRSVALVTDATASPLAFDFCAVSFDSQEVELYRFENATWTEVAVMPMSAPLGTYRITARTTAGRLCTVDQNELTTTAVAGVGDRVGFRIRNATARIAYLAVYRSP